MKTVNLYRFLQQALICVAALVGAAGPARADLVTGVWDPFFGGPFTNLGYRGSVVVNVPGACFLPPDGRVYNTDPCSNGAMTVTALTVEFYNAGNEVQPTLETLAFDPLALPVDYIDTLEGTAVGLGTGYAPWTASTLAFEGANGYLFSIYFSNGPLFEEGRADGAPPAGPEVRMVWKTSGSTLTVEEAVARGQVSNLATVSYDRTVTTVPEPGSLLLAGAALAAAAASMRRRSRHR